MEFIDSMLSLSNYQWHSSHRNMQVITWQSMETVKTGVSCSDSVRW